EPRDACHRHELQVVCGFEWKPECGHIIHCLVEQTVEFLIGSSDFEDPALPVCRLHAYWRLPAVFGAFFRRLETYRSISQLVKSARVPRSSRRQIDLEAQAAVGINGLSIIICNANVDLTPKILVPIGCTQLRRVSRPFRRDAPPPDNVFGFD